MCLCISSSGSSSSQGALGWTKYEPRASFLTSTTALLDLPLRANLSKELSIGKKRPGNSG